MDIETKFVKEIDQNIIDFLNINNITVTGNTTLITEENYNVIINLGSLITTLKNNNSIIGVLFSTIVTLNVGKSAYSNYLCVDKNNRKLKNSIKITETNLSFLREKLAIHNCYYLNHKNRHNGLYINSYYRVINYNNMKKSGFRVINDKKAKIKYYIKNINDYTITDGIKIDITKRNFSIFWNPSESEKKRFEEGIKFKTVCFNDEYMVFLIYPLECLINKTNKKVKIAMLSFFYITDIEMKDIFFKIIINFVRDENYDCIYGYTIGDITPSLVEENGSHVTDGMYYINFYNNINCYNVEKINILLF